MLPIVEDCVKRFDLKDFVIVADSGLMNKDNIKLLEVGKYKYIIGARIKNESAEVKQWILPQHTCPLPVSLTKILAPQKRGKIEKSIKINTTNYSIKVIHLCFFETLFLLPYPSGEDDFTEKIFLLVTQNVTFIKKNDDRIVFRQYYCIFAP